MLESFPCVMPGDVTIKTARTFVNIPDDNCGLLSQCGVRFANTILITQECGVSPCKIKP